MISYKKHALFQKAPKGSRPCPKLSTSPFGGGIPLDTPTSPLAHSFTLVPVKLRDLIKGIITINILSKLFCYFICKFEEN